MNSLVGPRDEVEWLVTKGLDLQKNANKSSVAVIQQQVSSVVTRLSLLDKQANEALNSLQVGLALLQYSIKWTSAVSVIIIFVISLFYL